jgi:hypothetical protein
MMSRHRIVIVSVISLLPVVLLSRVLLTGEDDEVQVSKAPASASSRAVIVPTRPQDEVVHRLREILRIREEAYRSRNSDLLHSIYSIDCPCLQNEERAITGLLDRGYVWDGISTSLDVRSVKKVNSRMWIILARFSSKALRIETESGKLVRQEQAGIDLFEFTLVKPRETEQWLLGRASVPERVE